VALKAQYYGRRKPIDSKVMAADDIFFPWQLAEGFRIFKNRSSGYWETVKALESILCIFLCASIALFRYYLRLSAKRMQRIGQMISFHEISFLPY
jgi:hypothetical protein